MTDISLSKVSFIHWDKMCGFGVCSLLRIFTVLYLNGFTSNCNFLYFKMYNHMCNSGHNSNEIKIFVVSRHWLGYHSIFFRNKVPWWSTGRGRTFIATNKQKTNKTKPKQPCIHPEHIISLNATKPRTLHLPSNSHLPFNAEIIKKSFSMIRRCAPVEHLSFYLHQVHWISCDAFIKSSVKICMTP